MSEQCQNICHQIPIKDEMLHALLAQLFSSLLQQTVKDTGVLNVLRIHQIASINKSTIK